VTFAFTAYVGISDSGILSTANEELIEPKFKTLVGVDRIVLTFAQFAKATAMLGTSVSFQRERRRRLQVLGEHGFANNQLLELANLPELPETYQSYGQTVWCMNCLEKAIYC
jgi:hypothetical protein